MIPSEMYLQYEYDKEGCPLWETSVHQIRSLQSILLFQGAGMDPCPTPHPPPTPRAVYIYLHDVLPSMPLSSKPQIFQILRIIPKILLNC